MSGLDANIQQNISGSGNIFTATGDVFVIQKPESATEHQLQTNLRILLNKVRTFWVQGVLEKSIHHAVLINLEKEVRTDSVDHPWGMVLELPDNERHTLPPKTDILEIFNQSTRALLILGEPGSGKTTTLLDLARKLIEKGEQDISTEPIPVVFNLSSWGTSKSLFDWLVKELSDKYQIPKKIGKSWLEQNRILPLLDGFDEIAEGYRQNCIIAINEFIGAYGLPGLVVCSRIAEYTKLPIRLKLNAAICVQPLSDKQIDQYLKLALGKDHSLRGLLKKDDLLASLTKTPLFLSILCLAHRSAPEEVKNLSADSSEEYTQKLFDIYFERILKRKGGKNSYTPEQVQKTLSWLAKRMVEQNQSVFYVEQLQPTWLPLLKERFTYYVLSRSTLCFLVGFLGSIGFASLNTVLASGLIGILLIQTPSFLIGFIGWLSSEETTNDFVAPKNAKGNYLGWGSFIGIQIIVFVLWIIVISLLFTDFSIPSLLQFDNLIDTIDYIGLTTALLILFIFFILEIGLFILIWKFSRLLKYVIATSQRSFLIIIPEVISGIIFWLLFNRTPFALLLGVLIFNFLAFFLVSRLDGVANFLVRMFGYRVKRKTKDIRTVENLSWSWKTSIPIIISIAVSLYLFVYTSNFKNAVTLWNSNSGNIISTLQSTPSVHWDMAFNKDGSRIMLLGEKPSYAQAYLYDSANGKLITEFGAYQFVQVSFNNNGNRIILLGRNSDSTLAYLYDSASGKLITKLGVFSSVQASFNNDGSRIVLLGGNHSSVQAYLYDSVSGGLITELGVYQYPAQASFNSGSRLLVEGTGDCPLWCYAQLWNTETGELITHLKVDKALKPEDIGELSFYFDASDFTENNLIYQPISLSENTENTDVKRGYMIWDAETGSPVLFVLSNLTQNQSELYLGYIFPENENRITVEMSQISNLIIYDDNVLNQHPLTIRNNANPNGRTCYWNVKSQNIDCKAPNPGIDFGAFYGIDGYYIQSSLPSQYFTSSYREHSISLYDSSDGVSSSILPYIYRRDENVTGLELGIKNIEYYGVSLPVDVYPYSIVTTIENPALPRLITITGGDNPLRYGFGVFSITGIIVFIFIGLKTNVVENKVLPNQGILLSLKNSLLLFLIISVVSGVIAGVWYTLMSGGNKLWMYVSGVGILGGIIVWALYGGKDAVYHFTLRAILAKRGYLLWKLVSFLDFCADNLLLQKVGGGYIFIHRMLLENLAKKAKN